MIVAKMREPAERAYFEQRVRPLLEPGDDIPAELPLESRLELMRGAVALLNPITWREPFGLVMVEALASATPVLAFPNGAAPEIVDQGRTGYLCRDEEEMIIAVGRVHEIERRQCRAAAERRFSLERMALDHQRLYRRILCGQGQLSGWRAAAGPHCRPVTLPRRRRSLLAAPATTHIRGSLTICQRSGEHQHQHRHAGTPHRGDTDGTDERPISGFPDLGYPVLAAVPIRWDHCPPGYSASRSWLPCVGRGPADSRTPRCSSSRSRAPSEVTSTVRRLLPKLSRLMRSGR